MIQFIAGGKGEGKTKRLIKMANDMVETTHGDMVYIDDDDRHIHDLHRDIRFVETAGYPLSNYREFVGFISGILSQNNDITEIFIDGVTNIIGKIDNQDLISLINKLKMLSEDHEVHFIITMNVDPEELPEEIKELTI